MRVTSIQKFMKDENVVFLFLSFFLKKIWTMLILNDEIPVSHTWQFWIFNFFIAFMPFASKYCSPVFFKFRNACMVLKVRVLFKGRKIVSGLVHLKWLHSTYFDQVIPIVMFAINFDSFSSRSVLLLSSGLVTHALSQNKRSQNETLTRKIH